MNNDLGNCKFIWTNEFTIPIDAVGDGKTRYLYSLPEGCKLNNSISILFVYHPTNDPDINMILTYASGFMMGSGIYCLTNSIYMQGARAKVLLIKFD